MKKIAFIFLTLLCLAGCETRTDYGECRGAFEARNPKLEYKLSVRNTVIGIVFLEAIFTPVVVVADETVCPVGAAPTYARRE